MSDPKIVYVTKYGLTEGIVRTTINEKWSESGGLYVWVDWPAAPNKVAMLRRTEAHLTEGQARGAVRAQATRKIASLKKQIAKLENYEPPVIDKAGAAR